MMTIVNHFIENSHLHIILLLMNNNQTFTRPRRHHSYITNRSFSNSNQYITASGANTKSNSLQDKVSLNSPSIDMSSPSRDGRPQQSTSPVAWIYKVGSDMMQMGMLPCTPPKGLPVSQRKATQTILSSDEDSDDESLMQRIRRSSRMSSPTLSPSFPTTKMKHFALTDAESNTNSIRVVAPNVGKLSRGSVVEIILNSINESVVVLCSVDILKMRSAFFGDILREREEAYMLNSTKMNEVHLRDSISLPEQSPFEAAAYLESLHEGRALFKGEWNLCWARLSVMWYVEEHQIEYAAQIEAHTGRLLDYIKLNNWRVNSNVLAGCRVALFRKNSGPTPTVIVGTAIESHSSSVYSKVRVLFDNSRYNSENINVATSPIGVKFDRSKDLRSAMSPLPTPKKELNAATDATEVVGDVELPFWVQRDGCPWMDPDDLFAGDSKTTITLTDKRMFWEMCRVLIEFPELTANMSSSGGVIKTSKDLARVLKRPENKVLWTPDAPEYVPKDAACELLSAAYVSSTTCQEGLF